MGSRHFWIESQCWEAQATRKNVDSKPDYLITFSYTNGMPMTFSNKEDALAYAVSKCNDKALALINPAARRTL